MAAGILVWSERQALAAELLGQARRVADTYGGEVALCVSGEVGAADLDAHGAFGADVVYTVAGEDASPLDRSLSAGALAAVVDQFHPALVLVGATKTGLEVAPRVAERCAASYAAWALGIETRGEKGTTTAECMIYAGSGVATYRFLRSTAVVTVAPGTFSPCELVGRSARKEAVAAPSDAIGLRVIGERPKDTVDNRLQEAKAVVDIGRGVSSLDELEAIRPLAGLLDAQLGCSRPVSSDRDWMPEWLGLSGAKVKPEFCLTVGISGAIQHIVGIRGSRVIAAVNNDETAAIFTQTDIGVVADLRAFLPVFFERLKARGAHPVWR
jgi:electron transfer flavoprotein alpha subunit